MPSPFDRLKQESERLGNPSGLSNFIKQRSEANQSQASELNKKHGKELDSDRQNKS